MKSTERKTQNIVWRKERDGEYEYSLGRVYISTRVSPEDVLRLLADGVRGDVDIDPEDIFFLEAHPARLRALTAKFRRNFGGREWSEWRMWEWVEKAVRDSIPQLP